MLTTIRASVVDRTGQVSSKRIAMLSATFALAVATIILACAAFAGHDVAGALAAVAAPLALLGGASYVGGKHVELGAYSGKNKGEADGSS